MSENKNMRELSLDEMDKVSGGTKEAPLDYKLYGLTQREAGSLLQGFVDNFGTEFAIYMANTMWGKTPDWGTYLRESEGSNAGYYAVSRIWGKRYSGA